MSFVLRQVSEATTAAGREQALTAELRQQLSAANADAARQVLSTCCILLRQWVD